MEHIRKHQTLAIGPPAQKRIGVLPYCAFKSCETASGPLSLANLRDTLPLFLTVRNTVPQFIMLIQLSPGNAGSPRSVVDEAERISSHLKRIVPQVALVQRHVVKNHCDLVDVLEAPNFQAIEHAANTIESLGYHVTDLMSVSPVGQSAPSNESRFVGPRNARLDPVQEASEESFPASDAPGWTGSIATKAPVANINWPSEAR